MDDEKNLVFRLSRTDDWSEAIEQIGVFTSVANAKQFTVWWCEEYMKGEVEVQNWVVEHWGYRGFMRDGEFHIEPTVLNQPSGNSYYSDFKVSETNT